MFSKIKYLIKTTLEIMTRDSKGRGGGEGVDTNIDIDSICKVIKESDELRIEGMIVRIVEDCVEEGWGVGVVVGVVAGRRTRIEMSNGDDNKSDYGNGTVRYSGAKKSIIDIDNDDDRVQASLRNKNSV